jgi:hypothetical protein
MTIQRLSTKWQRDACPLNPFRTDGINSQGSFAAWWLELGLSTWTSAAERVGLGPRLPRPSPTRSSLPVAFTDRGRVAQRAIGGATMLTHQAAPAAAGR